MITRTPRDYKISYVCKQLGISATTFNRRVAEGVIPVKVYGPKTRRVTREVFIQLKQHGVNGTGLRT